MLSLALPVDIFLCLVPADMRRSFDGLLRMVDEHLRRDALSGGLYVFINRRRDRTKLLYWDGDGLAIWYKRIEIGTFQLPLVEGDEQSVSLSGTELTLLLRGIDLTSVRQRKRYERLPR
jgi:transposase